MSFIINIFGPSAAGKSTISQLIQDSLKNLDVIDFDVIKRQIPHYDWTQHAHDGRRLTLDKLSLDSMSEDKILLLMPSSKNVEEFYAIQSIANARNYKLYNVELNAPDKVLIERYRDRLANLDPSKKDWKFKTLDEFKAKLIEPYYKPTDTISFDSSENSPEDIAVRIMDRIKDT